MYRQSTLFTVYNRADHWSSYSFVVDFNSGLLSNMLIEDDTGTKLATTAVGWKWPSNAVVPNEMKFEVKKEADVVFTAISEDSGSSFVAPTFDYNLRQVNA